MATLVSDGADVDAMLDAVTMEVEEPVVVVYTAQPCAHDCCSAPCSHIFSIPNRDLDSVPRRRSCGEGLSHSQSVANRSSR